MDEDAVGWIIVNPNTDELDWDARLFQTKDAAIESLTGFHDPYVKTEEEAANDAEKCPWWEDYEILRVVDPKRGSEE